VLAVLGGIWLVGFAVRTWQPFWAIRALSKAFGGCVWYVETSKPIAALSFDDGPDPENTPRVLDLLRQHGFHATFFLIGENAARHPGLVARIRAEGHEAGNHYLVNGATLLDTDEEFTERLTRTEALLGKPRPTLFRPPGGVCWPGQRLIASARGYTCVLGSDYPYDPTRPPVRYMQWLVAKNLKPGAIVILHDGGGDRSKTMEALPRILDTLDERGLRGVSVSELLRDAPR